MVFSSSIFLTWFLPLLLFFYFLSAKRYRNTILLIGSILFYSWGAPRFIFVILGTTLIDFFLVRRMHASPGKGERKAFLIISLAINLGLLFYFKYCNFFIGNINSLAGHFGMHPIGLLDVVMPIGISFYTFETVTYVVDVYRGVHKPLDNFRNYLLYIILFPKLIAGPIIRYHEIADQITDRPDTVDDKLMGFYRFCIGLAKKVLIANHMAAYADHVFNADVSTVGMSAAWLGALAYTLQIYFDFSGYSDMAIGLGRMLGFKFPENFNNPYIAESITDFWRRWHMTLGNWMRNYLYIPLGGNRVSTLRLYFNLCLVFILSGFWHGAAWHFIFWGAWHGFFLVIERLFLLKLLEKIGRIPRVAFTFLVVLVGWVLFRSEYMMGALRYFKSMLGLRANTAAIQPDATFWFPLALALVFSFFCLARRGDQLQQKIYFNSPKIGWHFALTVASMTLCILSLSYITSSGFNPFIYFRF